MSGQLFAPWGALRRVAPCALCCSNHTWIFISRCAQLKILAVGIWPTTTRLSVLFPLSSALLHPTPLITVIKRALIKGWLSLTLSQSLRENSYDSRKKVINAVRIFFILCRENIRGGGNSIAPKTASANAANAKVRNRQMIGRPIIL